VRRVLPDTDERGTALIEFVWLALLLLIPLVYVVLEVFDAQRTSYAAAAAARSAGRAFATAPDAASAYARAHEAVRLAFADQGVEEPVRLTIRCRPDPQHCLSPGSVITAEVHTTARLPLMPAVLGSSTPRIRVESVHSAPYGTFREAR
jgi:Flp pilus assembly protein TadG